MIKLLILDIDGVLTNGKKLYSSNGLCEYKVFCDKDFTIIKRLKSRGIHVVALTGDTWNEKILKNRNIDCYASRSKHKEDMLESILKKYNVSLSETAYIGDDIFDYGVMELVRYPFCPSDAIELCKNICQVIYCRGGENFLVAFFDYTVKKGLIPLLSSFKEEVGLIFSLDKEEKF